MLRGIFGNLIFAIIARTLYGNHLNCHLRRRKIAANAYPCRAIYIEILSRRSAVIFVSTTWHAKIDDAERPHVSTYHTLKMQLLHGQRLD